MIIISYIQQRILEIVGLMIITCGVWFFALSPRGELLTQQVFDVVRTTNVRSEVVILGVDDTSLQTVGAWPWNRSIFARVTKKLDDYGAKAVVFDVLFLEERDGDDAFHEVLRNVKVPVVLASKLENGKYLESFLVRQSSSTMITSALSNVDPDSDGKVRRYPVAEYIQGECMRGLGEQAFRISTFKKETTCEVTKKATFRYPSKVTTYSIVDILSGKISEKELKGKVVFIGSTSLDLEDHFVGITGEKIPGVEVHASIVTSLLNQEGDRELGSGEILLVIILLMGLVLCILYYVKTTLGQVVSAIGTALVVVIVSYMFFSNHIIMPLPWMILAVLSSGGFSTLVRFMKEKKRSEHIASLFSKYVHKDVLKELMKSPESINLTGEKRYLTILFSDLRGFTTLSESLSPEDLTTILNGYFSAMTPAVLEEHGTIDKYIGDAIMAFWNAPLEVKNHERHAVISALRMQEDLKKFNKEHNTSLAVGVGIHAGNAVVGNVGSKERVNYTVLGDTVNLASRVEGLTKKYGVEVLVTEEVKDKVEDKGILFRRLDIITVKGKNLPTVLYEAMRMDTSRASIVKVYDEAFLKYQNGEFEKAKELFKALADKGDAPGGKMYERIMNLGEVHNWDGIWHFDEK